MNIRKRNQGNYLKRRLGKILLLWMVVLLSFGCTAVGLLAHQPGGSPIQAIDPRWDGNRIGILALGLLITSGLLGLFSLGGGDRERTGSDFEEIYKILFEESPTANIIISSDGDIKDVNKSAMTAFGCSAKSEFVGRPALKFVIAEHRSRLTHLLEGSDGDKVRDIEMDVPAKDGQIRSFLFSSSRVVPSGEVKSADVLLVGIDITDRRQAERALERERQRLFSVLDVIPAFVYLQAPDYTVPFVNRKFRELFGDPKGQLCYEAFYGRQKPCDPCITLRVLRTRSPQTWEWTSQEGRTYLIYEDLFPGTDGEEMVMEIGIDITERKQAEEALRIGRERYALATHAAKVGVWDWNLKTGEFYLDPNIKATLGYADEEIPNDLKTWTTYVHPDDREPVMEAAQAHLEGKTPDYVFEHRMLHKDGSHRWIMVRGKAIRDDSGSVVRMVGTDTDITQRKLAEQAGARHTRNLEFLSEATMGFVELPPDEDIYRFIGEQLKRIVPDAAYIAVNSFDPEEQKIRVECVLGGGGFIEAVWKTIGRDPTGMSFDISQEAREGLTMGKLTKVPGGLHELAFRQLPKIACSALEKLVGIGDIHAMGFAKKGELYGSAVLILRKGEHLGDQDTIEALVHQAGVALQRRQAEEALEMERKKLESVTRNVGVGLALISKDYRTLWANQVLKRMFGDVEGSSCHAAYNHRKEVCPGCGVAQVLEHGKDQVVHEQVGKDKDGKTVWSQIIATPIKDAQGNVTSALEVVIPITERKQNEQLQSVLFKIADATHTTKSLAELFRRIQMELGTVLDTRNFFVALYDKTTATPILSYHVDEKKELNSFPHGRTLTSWVIRNNQPLLCTEDVRAKLLEAGEVEPTGTPSKTWLGVPLKVEEEVIGVVGVQNYTDAAAYGIKELEILQFASGQIATAIQRKQAQEALKRSEIYYRGIFEGAHDAILIFEPERETVLDVNQRACDVYGLDRSEFVGMTLEKISKDVPRGKKHIGLTLEKGAYHRFETVQYRKDGSEMFLEVNASVVDYKGRQAILSINRDITERKQAEEKLKSSERRYMLLFERNLAAVYQTTLDGKVVDCNLSFARLVGYDSPEEVLTHNASEFYFDSADRENFLAQLEQRGSLTDFEFRLRRKDAQPIWILENVNLIKGAGDTPPLIQGTCIDITQRRQAEEALQSSEDRYRSLFYDSPISLWEEDFSEVKRHLDRLRAAGIADFRRHLGDHPQEATTCAAMVRVTNVNRASMNLYQAQSVQQLKSALGQMLAREEYHPFKDELICIAEGRTSFQSEAVTYTLTGEKRHVMMKWSVLPGYEETLSKVVVAMTDITEQRHAQEELEEERERYRNLFETAPDSITILDTKGFITSCNAATERIAGYPRKELIGKHFSKIGAVRTKDLPKYLKLFGAIIRGKLPEPVELEIMCKDGSTYHVEAHVSLLKEGGRIVGVQVITRDITERKHAEEALRESEERFRIASQIASDVVYERDTKTGIATFYGNIDGPLGYEPGGYPHTMEGWRDHVHPEDLTWIDNQSIDQLEPGVPYIIEYRMRKKDGTYMTWLDRIMIIRDKKTGKPLKFIGAATDITERKRAEEALRSSEERLRVAVGNTGIVLANVDPELRYTWIYNPHPEFDAESVVGKRDDQLTSPENSGKIMDIKREAIQTGKGVRREFSITLHGDRRTYDFVAEPLLDSSGIVVGLTTAGIDITERKRAEEEVKKLSQYLESIIDNANVWMDVLDEKANVVIWNKASEKISGYSREEVLGHGKIWEWLYPNKEYRNQITAKASAIIERGEEVEGFETTIKCKDGEIRTISWNSRNLVDEKGTPIGSIALGRDVTERKRAEEALRDSEEKYRSLVQSSNDMIFSVDREGVFETVGGTRLKEFGLAPKDVMGKSLYDLFPREEAEFYHRKHLKVFDSGIPETYEHTFEFTGLTKTDLITVYPIKDEKGEVRQVGVVCRDITESKRAEEALRDSRLMLQTVLDSIPAVVFWKDRDLLYLGGSRTFLEAAGLKSSEDIVGKSDYELPWGREQADSFREDDRRVIESGIPKHNIVEPYLRTDGTTAWAKTNKAPLRDAQGNIVGVLGTNEDITERRRAEEALRESEEKHRTYVENAPDGIFITNSDGRYVDTNQAACRLTGYSRDELLNMRIMDLAPPDKPLEEFESFEELKRNGKTHSEIVIRRKDGTLIHASLDAVALSDGRYMAFCSDITGRKKAEEALQRAHDQLETRVRERTAELTRANQDLREQISDRQRAEKALVESEERFRSVFENAPLGIGLSAMDGRIIACNDTMLQMTGYTEDELKSINLEDTYQRPRDRELLLGRLREERGLVRFEVPRKRKDDSIYVASMTVTRVSLGGETVLLTIAEDITRRKRAEEELGKYRDRLEESVRERTAELRRTNEHLRQEITERRTAESALAAANQRMRVLQEITATVHKSLDPQSVFAQITDAIVNSLGFTTALIITQSETGDQMKVRSYTTQQKLLEPIDQLLGFSIRDFSFPADPQTNASIAKAMNGETVVTETLEEAVYPLLGRRKCSMLQKLGGTRNYIIVPLTSEGKTVGGIFATSDKESVPSDEIEILDIFARTAGQAVKNAHLHMKTTQAERALRASEQRYRSIFNQARDGIVLVDAETGQIADCNPEFENQTGRNSRTLKEMHIWEVRPPQKMETARKKFWEIAEAGAGDSSELEFQKPNGETVQVEFAARAVRIGDKKFIQSLVRDITDKKKMEAHLIQAERLAAVGTLAYGIAHEFNNIVAGILGNAEFGMCNDDPKEVEECFRVIMENCDRAKSITNHLLAFARQREAKKKVADVTETIDNVLGLIERELEKENMRVEREFDPVPQIFCDPGELSEVFLNMITNARDAMSPDGGILNIGIRQKGDDLQITFTDTGCGIPDAIKGRIFEPFVTTKGALGQSEVPGTGLGLFLSIGIVTRYHGRIDVESREGMGSTFTISIPISGNQIPPGQAEIESRNPAFVPRNLRILLVDDEKPICKAVKNALEADGHSVVSTTSGKKGLSLFKDGSFDLVLSDITMPDMDGVKLMSAVKGLRPQVKLIALTGHVKDERLMAARNAGADQILIKPFKKEDLYRAIGKTFS